MPVILSMIERIIFLKQVVFFQNMPIDRLKALAGICVEEFIPKNVTIFHEGDPGGVLYIVVNGRVAIEHRRNNSESAVRLATMDAYSSFGEMSLFNNYPRSASVLTIEESLVLKLNDKHLLILLREYPDMALELINVMSKRLRDTNEQLRRTTETVTY